MRTALLMTLFTAFILTCCAKPLPKLRPEYNGIPKETVGLVNTYIMLGIQNNIRFSRKITIGFKKIDRDRVIGLCTYGHGFREIDLDLDFWKESSRESKLALLFHELTHCLCGRGHDFGDGTPYPEEKPSKFKGGRYKDGCPMSLMFPELVDDDCVDAHFGDYEIEMFSRCRPY